MTEDSQTPEAAPNSRERGPTKGRAVRRTGCPCPAHQRIRALELANEAKLSVYGLADACEARAEALWDKKQYIAAMELTRIVDAIRRVA
jgi:hypothetical protein